MKKCYKDPDLNVSRDAFDRPAKLSIKVDCWKKPEVDSTAIDEPNLDEFGL
jgi:penicillin-binding protein 1A